MLTVQVISCSRMKGNYIRHHKGCAASLLPNHLAWSIFNICMISSLSWLSVSSHSGNARMRAPIQARIGGMRAQWARISGMRIPLFAEHARRTALVVEFFFSFHHKPRIHPFTMLEMCKWILVNGSIGLRLLHLSLVGAYLHEFVSVEEEMLQKNDSWLWLFYRSTCPLFCSSLVFIWSLMV